METNAIWKKYEKSHAYTQKKGLVTSTNKNWDFYIGNQWKGVQSGSEKLPSLNFIKPIIKYKTSTVAQHSMVANYSDMESRQDLIWVYEKLNQLFAQSWENGKMDVNAWDCIKHAAIQGDSYAYWGTSDTNEEPQIISNTAVFLGDENTPRIQEQPYIIIKERLSVSHVRKIAEENKVSKADIETITSDSETNDQIVNKEEVKDKVTSLLYLEKKDGIVHVARATKTCIYEKLHALNVEQNKKPIGGARAYPLVNLVWEKKPNSARGVSEVEMLIPNQLELNKTLARRAITVKQCAFPRIAYDSTAIDDPSVLDNTGAAIGMNTGTQSINQVISYLNATNISSDADKLSNDLLGLTRELAGAGDYATGNVNPEQASGTAIIAVRDQSQVPLNEQVSSYRQFVEDVALVWFDIWSTYRIDEFSQATEVDGKVNNKSLDYSTLSALKPTIRIDVSQNNQWTKLAEQQTIDNLFAKNQITLEEYAVLCPDNGAVPKGKLLNIVEQRKQAAQQSPSQVPVEGQVPQVEI